MNRYIRPLTAVIAGVAVIGVAGAATAQTAIAPAHPAKPAKAAKAKAAVKRGWKMHKTLSSSGRFWDTAASSWYNAWAVGNGASTKTGLAWRWNGHKWAAVKLPAGTPSIGEVSTAGTGNTWLLAQHSTEKRQLLRWNKGKWSNPGDTHSAGVYTMAAAGANQLWAAGEGFVRHYTGSDWTEKKLPKGVSIDHFGVNHYNDVWAVGDKTDDNGDDQPFAMHWNGSTWTTTPVPAYSAGDGGTSLDSVAFAGDNDVYASGDTFQQEEVNEARLVHWNGTKWSKVSLPKAVSESWMGGVGVTPVGGGGIWYAWAHRHFLRRTPSGATTDYKLPAKAKPYVDSVAHIPGSKTTLAVGSTTEGEHPFIALGN